MSERQKGLFTEGELAARRTLAPPKEKSDHQKSIDAFDQLFREHNGGAAPTWNGKNLKLLSQLTKLHGSDEVIRRARVMFEHPERPWPREPYDVAALAKFFDLFACAPRLSPDQAWAIVAREISNVGRQGRRQRFDDIEPLIEQTVMEIGWVQLCSTSTTVGRRQFCDVYRRKLGRRS